MDTIDPQYRWQPFTCRVTNRVQGGVKQVRGYAKTDHLTPWYSKNFYEFDALREPALTGRNITFYICPGVDKIVFAVQGVLVCSFPFTKDQNVLQTVKSLIDCGASRYYLRKKISALFTYEACHNKYYPVFNIFYPPVVSQDRQYHLV